MQTPAIGAGSAVSGAITGPEGPVSPFSSNSLNGNGTGRDVTKSQGTKVVGSLVHPILPMPPVCDDTCNAVFQLRPDP